MFYVSCQRESYVTTDNSFSFVLEEEFESKEYNELLLSDLVTQYKSIHLGENSITPITYINFLLEYNNNIFIIDRQGNQVLRFDSDDGKFINFIGKSGNGPGEFILPQFLDVSNDTVFLLDSRRKKIIYFDLNGNYLNDVDVSRNGEEVTSFVKITNGFIIEARPYHIDLNKKHPRITVLDNLGNVKNELLHDLYTFTTWGSVNNFFKISDNAVLLTLTNSNQIFKFKDGKLIPFIEVNPASGFDSDKLSSNYWLSRNQEIASGHNEYHEYQGLTTIVRFFQSENGLIHFYYLESPFNPTPVLINIEEKNVTKSEVRNDLISENLREVHGLNLFDFAQLNKMFKIIEVDKSNLDASEDFLQSELKLGDIYLITYEF